MMLKDAPGGAQLIETLTEAVKTLSLAYAGTPDDRAGPHLEGYLNSIEPCIIEAVGAAKAQVLLEVFRLAVMGRKHEIEAQGTSRWGAVWAPQGVH